MFEFLTTALLTLTILGAGLPTAYFAWTKLWVRHVLYETLVCQMTQVREQTCFADGKSRLQLGLPFGNLKDFRIKQTFVKSSGRVRLEITEKLWIVEGITLYRRDGGFAQIPFLLPLGLCLLVAFGFMALTLNERSRHLQACRHNLLLASQHISDGVDSILNLNPRIRYLHRERDLLEKAKLAAANPKARLAIEALVRKNELQQKVVVVTQENIKKVATQLAKKEISNLKGFLRSASTSHTETPEPNLRLESDLTHHTAKIKNRSVNFSRRHQIHSQWKMKLKFIEAILKIPVGMPSHLVIRCSTNIRQEGNKWFPQLAN